MSRIDFPKYGDTHIDENGQSWKKINNSWVKQFDWSIESPVADGVQYCKLNQVWTQIVFPVGEDDPNDAQIYARQSNGWVPVTTNVGPAAPGVDGLLYGIRDGAWDLIPGDDLTVNYYDKTSSDARYATSTHVHVLADITDSGAMAAVADAGAVDDDKQWVRTNHAWAELSIPTVPKHSKAITIIDPQGTDDALIFRTPSDITISSVYVAVMNGSVSFNIFHASTADGSGGGISQLFTSDQTVTDPTGVSIVVDNATVPAGDYVWVIIQGDPDPATTMFHITLAY